MESPNFSVNKKLKPETINFSTGGVMLSSERMLKDVVNDDILNTEIDAYSKNTLGDEELRTIIASKNTAYFSEPKSFENVVISEGVNRVISITLEVISQINLNQENGILFFSPYFYNTYFNAGRNKFRIYEIQRYAKQGFKISIEEIEDKIKEIGSQKLKVIYLVNPDNPTGTYHDDDFITKLAALCLQNNIYLILDNSFDGINLRENQFVTHSYVLNSKCIVVGGLSKTMALAGIRVGYGVLSKEIVDSYGNIQDSDGIHHGIVDQRIGV